MATTAEVTDRVTLTAAAEFACYTPSKEQPCWAIASMRAPLYEPTSRSPVDIAAVIDKSGSMRGSKLELVKKTLLFVIDQCECLLFNLEDFLCWGWSVELETCNGRGHLLMEIASNSNLGVDLKCNGLVLVKWRELQLVPAYTI